MDVDVDFGVAVTLNYVNDARDTLTEIDLWTLLQLGWHPAATNMPIDINKNILPFPSSKIIIFTLFQFIYNLGEFRWLLLHVSHQNRQAAKFDAQVLSSALYFSNIEQLWFQIILMQLLVHRLTTPLLEGYSRVDFIRTQSSTFTRWMLRAGTNYQLSIIILNSRIE